MPTTALDPASIIASVAYSGGRKIGEVALDDISDVVERPDTFVWIGLYEPTEELLRKIQEEFGGKGRRAAGEAAGKDDAGERGEARRKDEGEDLLPVDLHTRSVGGGLACADRGAIAAKARVTL